MAQAAPDEALQLLNRLSQKPGVQSTLILSRDTGAIVQSNGLISKTTSANPNSTLPASENTTSDSYNGGRKESGMQSAEDVAKMIWKFMTAAGELAEGLFAEDREGKDAEDVKLVRLRTKGNEVFVYPDPKYLLVVIHDAPKS